MTELPDDLFAVLRHGLPVLLATGGGDDWPNVAFAWALAPSRTTVRFTADAGGTSEANLGRTGKASLEVMAPDNLQYLVCGSARVVVPRLPDVHPGQLAGELTVERVRPQSWRKVVVGALTYSYPSPEGDSVAEMERAVLRALRELPG